MAEFASNRLFLFLLLSITPQNFQHDIICDNVSVVVWDTMEVIKVFKCCFFSACVVFLLFNSNNKCNSNGKVTVIVIVIVWGVIVIVIGFLNLSSTSNSNRNRLPIHFQ